VKIAIIFFGIISVGLCFSLALYLLYYTFIVGYYSVEANEEKNGECIEPLIIPALISEKGLKHATEEVDRKVKARLNGKIDRVDSIFISEAQGGVHFITVCYSAKEPYWKENQRKLRNGHLHGRFKV